MTTRTRKTPAAPPAPAPAPAATLDLRPELITVREVMARLLRLWDAQGAAVTPEEARRLAALLFNGARTAALVSLQHARLSDSDDDSDFQRWLNAALDHLSEDPGVDL